MRIDIFSDVICPWCYIGKHRLDRALAERPDLAVARRWQPFQLNPDMPAGGVDRAQYLEAKYGSDLARRAEHALVENAARDGLVLNLDRIRRVPPTLDAHRLLCLAGRQGCALIERLFAAYFVEGLDIGDRAVLAAAATAARLDPDAVRDHLASDADADLVQATTAACHKLGIRGVPCFVFDGRYSLAGAQDPAAFLPLLDLVADETAASALG